MADWVRRVQTPHHKRRQSEKVSMRTAHVQTPPHREAEREGEVW
jgi:hypothetical protein